LHLENVYFSLPYIAFIFCAAYAGYVLKCAFLYNEESENTLVFANSRFSCAPTFNVAEVTGSELWKCTAGMDFGIETVLWYKKTNKVRLIAAASFLGRNSLHCSVLLLHIAPCRLRPTGQAVLQPP
jgi:hypothetical protein